MSSVTVSRMHELPVGVLKRLISSTPSTGSCIAKKYFANFDGVNWNKVVEDVRAHTLGPLFYQRLLELDALDGLPPPLKRVLEADAKHAELQSILQRKDVRRISNALSDLGIVHAFIKGAAFREKFYNPSWTRIGADIDLLVERSMIETARQALFALGFSHASSSIDYREFRSASFKQVKETEEAHYELAQFVKSYRLKNIPSWLFNEHFKRRPPFTFEKTGDHTFFHAVVDVHWALHFSFQTEMPLKNIVYTKCEGSSIPILNTAWNIFASVFKLYFEAFERPYYGFHHLADLCALVDTGPAIADWNLLDDLIHKYGLQAAAYYTLSAVSELDSAQNIPSELMEKWAKTAPSPDHMPDHLLKWTYHSPLDLGDFMPYLTGSRSSNQPRFGKCSESEGNPSLGQIIQGL